MIKWYIAVRVANTVTSMKFRVWNKQDDSGEHPKHIEGMSVDRVPEN